MLSPVCSECGGSGWKITEREGLSGAERCDCTATERSRHILANSHIPPLYQNASVDNFKLPEDNPIARRGLSESMLIVRGYVRDFPNVPKPGLLFIGQPGTGKTHLAVAALRALMLRGFEGVFFDYQNLLDQIRSGYDKSSGEFDKEAYRTALDAELLLLDDLGAHRVTEWVEDTVTSLITFRCNNRKPLIATTNLPDAAAGGSSTDRGLDFTGKMQYTDTLDRRIGARARSRLFEMCRIVQMPNVEDFRIRNRK